MVIYMKEIVISKNDGGQRADKFLIKYFSKAPKGFVYKMLRKKRIKLNGSRAEGGEMLAEGDRIQMYLSDETIGGFREEKRINRSPLSLIYEDENIIVADKPAGTLSHAESPDDRDTLIDRVLSFLNEKGEYDPGRENSFVPALCNRLDRNTSGIVIAGKTAEALFIHRNSLQYRMNKIEELLEIGLDDYMEYLNLINCILIKKLMFS